MEPAWFHAWCDTSKIPSPCYCVSNWDWTYPWPIFSNRVYFFLGSPTLTMLPERNKDAHLKWRHHLPADQTCSSTVWGCELFVVSWITPPQAQMASTKTDFLQSFEELALRRVRTWRNIHKSAVRKEQVPMQVFVDYKHLWELEQQSFYG